MLLSMGSSRMVIIFMSVHGVHWEGRGQGTEYFFFFKCLLWCIVILRSLKINIFKVPGTLGR